MSDERGSCGSVGASRGQEEQDKDCDHEKQLPLSQERERHTQQQASGGMDSTLKKTECFWRAARF